MRSAHTPATPSYFVAFLRYTRVWQAACFQTLSSHLTTRCCTICTAWRTTKSHWPLTVVAWRRPVTVFAGLHIPRVKVTCYAIPQLLTVIFGVATPNERLLLTTPSRVSRGIRRSTLAAWHASALKQMKTSWEVCGSSSRFLHQQWLHHSFFVHFLLNRLSLNS